VRYEFDAAKNKANIAKHGIDMALAERFELEGAVIKDDDREQYGETRYAATGHISDRVYVLIFTWRADAIRVISLRKANRKEQREYYEQA
jgi:uncharacterized DUF497 family protein